MSTFTAEGLDAGWAVETLALTGPAVEVTYDYFTVEGMDASYTAAELIPGTQFALVEELPAPITHESISEYFTVESLPYFVITGGGGGLSLSTEVYNALEDRSGGYVQGPNSAAPSSSSSEFDAATNWASVPLFVPITEGYVEFLNVENWYFSLIISHLYTRMPYGEYYLKASIGAEFAFTAAGVAATWGGVPHVGVSSALTLVPHAVRPGDPYPGDPDSLGSGWLTALGGSASPYARQDFPGTVGFFNTMVDSSLKTALASFAGAIVLTPDIPIRGSIRFYWTIEEVGGTLPTSSDPPIETAIQSSITFFPGPTGTVAPHDPA